MLGMTSWSVPQQGNLPNSLAVSLMGEFRLSGLFVAWACVQLQLHEHAPHGVIPPPPPPLLPLL